MTMPYDLRQVRYERACWWLERSVEIVPLQARSKNIQPGYGSRQTHITTTDFARKWFLNTEANLGVVLGGTSGLVVADWDDAQEYKSWRRSIGTTIETLTEQTARGYHAFFQGVHLPSATSNTCEFKTSGVCMVASSVHPSGMVYRIVQDMPIAILTEDKARLLFPFLSEREVKPIRRASDDTRDHLAIRKERSSLAGNGVVACIKAVWSVENEISASGVQLHPAGLGELVGLCPFDHGGHKDSRPSLWVNILRQRWGCYAPGCESNAGGEKAHDVVNYRALLRGISNREAIRQLASELFPLPQDTGKR
jgi:hypothetical protein